MYAIDLAATVDGDAEALWEAWTDMERYPDWDPREEEMRLDSPFAVGASGFSKQVGRRPGSPFRVTRVEPRTRWTIECPLPAGKLVLDHWIEPTGDGRVTLKKRYEVHGPMTVLFRLVIAKGIRAEMPETFAALAREADRRRTSDTAA
jgi:uncharacterized protein YndB with AHSA1/START domain